jgi:hypothetical protein
MRSLVLALALGAFAAVPALADTMHPVFGARVSGMGDHGIVNFHSYASQSKLCWTFELGAKGLTGASIRDAHGMAVARLGTRYSAKGCTKVVSRELNAIESKLGSYFVWVDTKGHPGDLRGKLVAGMVHM